MAKVTNLTAAQICSLYEILELPYSDSYYIVDSLGTAPLSETGPSGSTYPFTSIKSQVDDFLDSIGSDPIGTPTAIETKITALITSWDAIRLNTVSVQSGSTGSSLTGVTYDYEQKRSQIKILMETYVPYIKKWRAELRQAGSANNGAKMVKMAK